MDAHSSPFEEFVRPSLSDEALDYLQSTAKWTQFISIVGFVIIGLLTLGGISFMVIGSSLPGMEFFPMAGGIIGASYLIVALIIFAPVFYLYRFSTNLRIALRGGQEAALTEGFRYLRAHYRFVGIILLIVIGLYAIAFLFMGLAAVFV